MTARDLRQPYSQWLDPKAACGATAAARQVSNLRKRLRANRIDDLVLTTDTKPARYHLNQKVRNCLLVE